ncbi:uncharacterized protein EI90DRAFT_74069 [Cantharellus anzutake]|uniref:uncharacterized protein n=1 Tax=Cantharellus anzutake TaxID=1750568 RepID=UPI001904D722|nr:uncharacterized protein EI90DRAFT_74069 [Cantharellus anzutake]KAF8336827.1 hypothetical protein EI90DRAFT_74069 [Cantharellus anzutake]
MARLPPCEGVELTFCTRTHETARRGLLPCVEHVALCYGALPNEHYITLQSSLKLFSLSCKPMSAPSRIPRNRTRCQLCKNIHQVRHPFNSSNLHPLNSSSMVEAEQKTIDARDAHGVGCLACFQAKHQAPKFSKEISVSQLLRFFNLRH